MSTQKEYLELQLKRILEEKKAIVRKTERLKFRFDQLLQQEQALKEDLQRQTSATTRRVDLKIVQVRKMQLDSTTKKAQV